ncbi:DNA ligase (Polydeoxyribonucleotide synthase) [Metarhizium robertsii ARSEF 23]|uniref:DNA ligase n=1 Tax=Metarhizium robertsii (strain ARSEF 23 / ATCC MYA-3075) TaxID=655844 RepID=E9EU61_METRA|nr:DNA ligase (Polydeoxyribonucleotide synthase) [Metarhizium robertsii ARSEF 23]EFZ00964.2 DNA ligase (Polydeoxyribonucleotide synthase) [Metarhizium robertsii ARSEF 23]
MAPPKQATLGYVKGQSTLGKFFGVKNPAPQQQTKLTFATKARAVEGGDEDASAKENTDPDHGEFLFDRDANNTAMKEGIADVSWLDSKKRARVPSQNSTVKLEDDEDDGPVVKRVRRSRVKVEEDEDDEPAQSMPKKEDNVKDVTIKQSVEEVPKKEGDAKDVKIKKKSQSPDPDRKPLKTADDGFKEEAASESGSEAEEDADVDEKPEVAAKAREKVQTQLQSKTAQHPYPDWQPGSPVPYAALCQTFSLIEMTTKRLIIMGHCSLFLRQVMRLTPDDLLPTVLLMINKLAPDYAGIELGIGESLIMKAIGETTGRSLQIIKADQKEIGDLGLVAVKSRSTQPTMFKPKPLTVRGVHQGLMNIATVTGNGAQGRKVDGIKKLLSAADAYSTVKADITKDKGGPSEAKFIIRFLEGKLRLGLAERTVLVSLAQAIVCHEAEQKGKVPSTTDMENGESILKTVYSELPSYDAIIPAVLSHGIMNLRECCKLRPGVPLKPMLAKPTKAITEVLDRFEGQKFTCEYKYDGERAQIHYVARDSDQELSQETSGAAKQAADGVASIFSRNSEDLSKKYPDILAKLHTWVKNDTKSFVLDCETVAWDVSEKKVLPFQQLMTRKKKDVKLEDVKVKVCVFAFDLLYLNGLPVVEKSLRERRELLQQSFAPVEGEFAFATYMDGQELDEIQLFLDESVKASCEGLMVKMLDGTESGYEPSKRSRNWLKVKKDYLAGVGDSLDLVVLGAYYGRGKRTSVYGAFLLACYNPANDTYETVCNIGTGFSEQVLEELHAQLSEIVIDRPKPFYSHSAGGQHQPDVWFEPRYVWEVKTADLTLSPRYKAGCKEGVDPAGDKGISLRFPRFIKIRDDKKPDEATSSRQIAEMYRKQESVTKNKGPSVDDDFEY